MSLSFAIDVKKTSSSAIFTSLDLIKSDRRSPLTALLYTYDLKAEKNYR